MNYLDKKLKEIKQKEPSREKTFKKYASLIEGIKKKIKKKKMPDGKIMSYRIFAEQVGVSNVMVFNWFNYKNIISLEKYIKAIDVLEIWNNPSKKSRTD